MPPLSSTTVTTEPAAMFSKATNVLVGSGSAISAPLMNATRFYFRNGATSRRTTMKTPAKKAAPEADKPKVPVTTKPITAVKPEPVEYKHTEYGVRGGKGKPTEFYAEQQAQPFGGKGDHDANGKPGGDAKAKGTEPRPMPKDFAPTITVEGSRVMARQDGIEVPFANTDDKKAYAEALEAQRQALWAALEYRRIRGLKA